ncbi:MAG: response regulator [Opitutaceae bacterium]|jgi:DNA-binding response OmpR family regulator|nr:response regulator [Opitutaceae bacterium]
MATKPLARILLVEDDQAIRETTADLLLLEGYAVDCASGGDAAVQHLTHTEALPDLILSDIMMPQGDGYLLLAHTQAHKELQDIPLIFLSARADKSDVRMGMSTGANDYLTKPFTLEDLRKAISSQLENARRRSAQFTQLRLQIAKSLPHELRTPLSGIMGFVDLLAEEARAQPTMSSQAVLESCALIGGSARRLHKQIQLLTMWVEITTQPAEVTAHFQENPATAWTSATSAECGYLASEHDRTGDLALQLEPAGVQMAATYLSTLVLELLENAFKFSTKGSPVKVSGQRLASAEYELTVQNEGRAFTPEQVRAVEAFAQFGRDYFEQQGLGVGLAIVFQLCALVGSKPTIVSEAGVTLIRVRIPLCGLEATLADPAEVDV